MDEFYGGNGKAKTNIKKVIVTKKVLRLCDLISKYILIRSFINCRVFFLIFIFFIEISYTCFKKFVVLTINNARSRRRRRISPREQ